MNRALEGVYILDNNSWAMSIENLVVTSHYNCHIICIINVGCNPHCPPTLVEGNYGNVFVLPNVRQSVHPSVDTITSPHLLQ